MYFLGNWYIITGTFVSRIAITSDGKTDIGERETPMCIATANRIINRTNAQNVWRVQLGKPRVKLTGKRLQKLLYLCQLFWFVDHAESSMISEDFQAWPNGPVIPEIYDFFSVFQDGDMSPLRNEGTYILTPEECDLINKVVDSTIDVPTEAIIDYTHLLNSPWDLVYRGGQGIYKIIPKESIRLYINDPTHQKELIDFIRNG